MTVHLNALLAIITMAGVTYLTRISGFLLLKNIPFSPRMKTLMDILPGCVLISIIAPVLASGQTANIIGLAGTAIAAARFSLLPTMIIGITLTGVVRLLS